MATPTVYLDGPTPVATYQQILKCTSFQIYENSVKIWIHLNGNPTSVQTVFHGYVVYGPVFCNERGTQNTSAFNYAI